MTQAQTMLEPCPFCNGAMIFRKTLWPSDGNIDAVIHAASTKCPMSDFSDGSIDESIIAKWNTRAPTAAAQPVADDLEYLVERFSKALLAKLKLARANGRAGWDHDDWEKECQEGLLRHLAKGDPRDVAAYCAFMWHHGWITAPPSPAPGEVAGGGAVALRDCLQSIADADEREPRQPDDADWRYRFLEAKRAAKTCLAALSTLPPAQKPERSIETCDRFGNPPGDSK